MSARVELLADRGNAAVEAEFFRSREFLAAERVTHTLLIESEGSLAAVPLLVREIPGTDLRDAISPYSYPGARVEGAPPDPRRVDLSASGLVSVFVRERLGDPPGLAGAGRRSVVLVSDPELPRKSRMSDRQQIRKNEAAGYETSITPGPRVHERELVDLHAVYTETMRAVEAAERYFFEPDYFRTLLGSPLSWLLTTRGPEGDCAAAALAVRSDGFLHYYLSGTADAHRRRAPSKNLIVATIELAEELGLPMNLGGGIIAGDGLEEFKRGFANRELPFRTHELICDPLAYERLCSAAPRQAPEGFFPAYRDRP